MDEYVNVAIRIKPEVEKSENNCLQVVNNQPGFVVIPERSLVFNFDNVFTDEVDQETVYNETVKPLVDSVIKGYKCTVFAYGQTGTGKTYTIGTNSEVADEDSMGLIPRALNDFLKRQTESVDTKIDISVSFIEIYNDKVFDLLQSSFNNPPLQVKECKVQGLTHKPITSIYEAKCYLEMGSKNRHTAKTGQNANSSRSHAIFTIYCNVNKNDEIETSSKLNLVDLAGSESIKKTGNRGSTLQEGININKGLLAISQVITALSNNANFVPHRQSVITSILKDSLDKQNYIYLIACVSALSTNCTETCQTLDFAQRAKRIKSKPLINEILINYKKNNPEMFQFNTRTLSTPFNTKFQIPRHTRYNFIEELPNTVEKSWGSSISTASDCFMSSDKICDTLSTVITKCMSTMENSIVHKMERAMENKLKLGSVKRTNFDNGDFTASSPIIDNLDAVKKVLSYESLIDDGEFKVPKPPPLKKSKTTQVSPVPLRRSLRISTKNNSTIVNDSFNCSKVAQLPRRRSIRLNKKQATLPKIVKDTPVLKRLKQQSTFDSPCTSHTKNVLKIINEGTLNDLVSLNTIGVKTAQQIMLCRQIKGKLTKISDIVEMASWSKKKYDNFVTQNFLKQSFI